MSLSPTGERVVEEHYRSNPEDYLIYQFHLATYQFSIPYTEGKRVLDLGCGSGYGAELIAQYGEIVVGVDISAEAISYASTHYNRPNLDFMVVENIERQSLPFLNGCFDAVLSFQVIEHLSNPKPYLQEVQRVLGPGGVFLLATPDRTGRLFPFQKPWNVWHTHEYTAQELHQLLGQHFAEVQILHMGGKYDLLKSELNRVRRIRWLTLPFTLPFLPERIRKGGLLWIKHWNDRRKGLRSSEFSPSKLDLEHITISPQQKPSINLIAIARNR